MSRSWSHLLARGDPAKALKIGVRNPTRLLPWVVESRPIWSDPWGRTPLRGFTLGWSYISFPEAERFLMYSAGEPSERCLFRSSQGLQWLPGYRRGVLLVVHIGHGHGPAFR